MKPPNEPMKSTSMGTDEPWPISSGFKTLSLSPTSIDQMANTMATPVELVENT